MLKEQNNSKKVPHEGTQRYNSMKSIVREPTDSKEPESPTHRYTQRAEQISKASLKYRKKSSKRKIICINSPQSELVLQETPRRSSQIRNKNGNSHFVPLAEKKETLEMRRSSISKESTPNLYLTIRLPHLNFPKTDPKPSRNKETLFEKTSYFASPSKPIKENIAITCNLQELCKIMKFRGDDVLILEGLVSPADGTLKVPVQLVDDIILKVEYRENVRIALESNKLSALAGLVVDDKEARKTTIKKIKKTIEAFERKCLAKNAQESPPSIVDQVHFIMGGQDQPVKADISQGKTLARTLRCAFQEQRIDPGFICQICVLYTRLALQNTQRKIVEVYNKAAAKALHTKRIWTRQISTSSLWISSMEMKQLYHKLCKEKILEILWAHNRGTLEEISEYIEGYTQRRKI